MSYLVFIPPELTDDPRVKKFLAYLALAVRASCCWRPKCPACGSDKLWRDGREARKTMPAVQRYECSKCGKKCSERTGTLFASKQASCLAVLSCYQLFLLGLSFRTISRHLPGTSHPTVMRWCQALELAAEEPVEDPTAIWIGDETFVRVAGKQMYELKIVDWHARTLARVLSPRRRSWEVQYLLQEATKRYPDGPAVFMHDGNPIYHRALVDRGLDWQEGVVIHQREFVAADGSTTNPLEGHWSHFHVWRQSHRGFKKWSAAQHYHEQYSRRKNQPNKTLLQLLLIPDR